MQACAPLQARQWYKFRDPINFLIAVTGFAVLNLIFWIFMGEIAAFFFAGLIMFAVFIFVLHKRAISIICPHCGKPVASNTPWVCGVCQWKNLRANDFPFIGRCGNYKCGAEPKAYECHHCFKLIFLTEDQQTTGYARSITSLNEREKKVEAPKPVRDPHAKAVAEKRKGIELKELAAKEAALEVQLKGFKDVLEPIKQKSKSERLRSGVRSRTELEDEVRRLKAEADKEFANDKEAREKRYREIDDEARELL